jgi:hypothetical protein
MRTSPRPTLPYLDTELSGAEQTRLASITAADGVTRVEGLLGDRGDEAIARLIALLEKVVENQLAAERRLKRLEQGLGVILREADLSLPPGLEPIRPAPPATAPGQALRKS